MLAGRNTELERVNGRLEQASATDPLTGLGNRRALIKEMPQLLARLDEARRPANRDFPTGLGGSPRGDAGRLYRCARFAPE
jgi:GGDEF domain-containing protein